MMIKITFPYLKGSKPFIITACKINLCKYNLYHAILSQSAKSFEREKNALNESKLICCDTIVNTKQAGAELCQAQFKLGHSMQALPNLISKAKLGFPSLGSFKCNKE